jgi:hypothetical protein
MEWMMIFKTLSAVLDIIKNSEVGQRIVRSGLPWFLCGISCLWVFENAAINIRSDDRELHQNVLLARNRVERANNPLFTSLWKQRFGRINADMYEINSGTVTIPAEAVKAVAEEMLRHVEHSLVATSTAPNWWTDDSGKRYEQRNMDLARDGKVRVTRIFLYANESERDELKHHLEDQRKAGIQVLTGHRGKRLEDYVLIDDTYGGILTLSDKAEIVDARFYFESARVEEVRQRITEIQSEAQLY